MLLALLHVALAAPSFSVEHGLQDAAFSLTITASDASARLVYSLDGSVPTLPYLGPLPISTTSIVRAREIATDGTASDIGTATYLYLDDVLTSAVMDANIVNDAVQGPILDRTLRDLPTISLVVPSALSTYEQEGSFEWMDPDGDDGQFETGIALTGTTSLGYPKNSIRLYFRSDYGVSRMHLDLYGDNPSGFPPTTSFDALSLRSGNHDTVFYLGAQGQYLRNRWMDESQLDMGHVNPHGRFAHLYLNGVYYGLYHVRERFGAAMMADYLGGDEEDYESINGGSVVDGSGAAWGSLVAAESNFQEAKRWLNVPKFLDYMILQFYAGNAWDWSPYHNWAAAGPAQPDQGGFIFESSDSDICLYYDYNVNILSNEGPSYLYSSLLAEGDPDFRVALADAIHRNLFEGGPLTADLSRARYARIAAEIDEAVVAESARWGGGWWDHDGEWVVERDRLLDGWFPYRTDALVEQIKAAGWYPLPAPELDPAPSSSGELVAAGTEVTVSVPDAVTADLYVATDGQDPRLSGGAVSPTADGPRVSARVRIDHSLYVRARLLQGDTWGPVTEAFYEVDEAPPVLLNEWNAVDADRFLDDGSYDGAGTDAALGRLEGNGGDWIELVVVQDHVDLRGWRASMADRSGSCGDLTFTDDPLLADLRAGTILTIAHDLPEDAAYDPDAGDWRFHLRAAAGGSGTYISATDFRVTSADWQLTLWDPAGFVRFGPAGEGVAPSQGVSGDEVGLLAEDPSDVVRRWSPDYVDGVRSTYGAPNEWEGGSQDLSGLRGLPPGRTETDTPEDTATEPPDTAVEADTGDSGAPEEADTAAEPKGGGCGCDTQGGPAPLAGGIALVALALARRRRRAALLTIGGLAACQPDTGSDGKVDSSTEENGGETGETATDTGADSGAPPDICYADEDGDGYGDPAAPVDDCTGAPVHDATDCDDDDPAIHPGVPESCNALDDDCDGRTDDDDDDVVDGLLFYADGDADGYGAADTYTHACTLGAGDALLGGDCNDADPDIHPDAVEACDDIDQDCDGLSSDALGASSECPATSCLAVVESNGPGDDGAYWLALPSGRVQEVWCDLTTDGGGWTLGFLRNSASTGNQGDFGFGEVNPDLLATSPAEASSSATAVMAWFDLNSLDWSDLRVGGYYNGGQSALSENIPRTSLRIAFGDNGYFLYGGDTPYYWCGGDRSYTDGQTGAVNNPAGAPAGCKGHGSLGSGWDFSYADSGNLGLTLCGSDGSAIMLAQWGATWVYYGTVGAAQAIWVR